VGSSGTTPDQHHVGSHRVDHEPMHEPGEDLGRKSRKLTAILEPAPSLAKKDRRRTFSMSSNSSRHYCINKESPIIEALSLVNRFSEGLKNKQA
jgi:hypothetical protein